MVQASLTRVMSLTGVALDSEKSERDQAQRSRNHALPLATLRETS